MPAEEAVARTAVIVIEEEHQTSVCAELPAERCVIAADSGLDAARALGLTVDLLVGDPGLRLSDRAGHRRVRRYRGRAPSSGEGRHRRRAGHRRRARQGCVHLIGVSGGPRADDPRLDHELGGLLAFARPTWAGSGSSWWGPTHLEVLHGPAAATLRGRPGDLVSLLPLHGAASGIVTEGLRFPSARRSCQRAQPGRATSSSTPATVRVALGTLLVIHPPPTGATT